MRNIIFRGKRTDNGKWVYGDLRVDPNAKECFICGFDYYNCCEDFQREPFEYRVFEETVGQFTDMHDKIGAEIYEGDVVKVTDWLIDGIYYITYKNSAAFLITKEGFKENYHGGYFLGFVQYVEVLGNIYDNPEIMEGE